MDSKEEHEFEIPHHLDLEDFRNQVQNNLISSKPRKSVEIVPQKMIKDKAFTNKLSIEKTQYEKAKNSV